MITITRCFAGMMPILLGWVSSRGGAAGATRPQDAVPHDTTLASAYATVLQVAWDSVLTPWFRLESPLPVILRDSSVRAPLNPEPTALPRAAIEQIIASGLAAAPCEHQDQ